MRRMKPLAAMVDQLTPLVFRSLIEDIVKGDSAKGCEEDITTTSEGGCKTPDVKYLVSFLEGDLIPRTCTFKADHDLRTNGTFSVELKDYFHSAVKFALPEVEKSTCVALKKLLLMIMELDSSRTIADMNGLISRADGERTPAAEIILDELTYNSDMLSPFFLVFDEPEWKLKLIVQYFQNYIPKLLHNCLDNHISNVSLRKQDYVDKAVMEEQVNGGRSRNRGFPKLLRGEIIHKMINRRAEFIIVVDKKLALHPALSTASSDTGCTI